MVLQPMYRSEKFWGLKSALDADSLRCQISFLHHRIQHAQPNCIKARSEGHDIQLGEFPHSWELLHKKVSNNSPTGRICIIYYIVQQDPLQNQVTGLGISMKKVPQQENFIQHFPYQNSTTSSLGIIGSVYLIDVVTEICQVMREMLSKKCISK